jgi:hypothetical protein
MPVRCNGRKYYSSLSYILIVLSPDHVIVLDATTHASPRLCSLSSLSHQPRYHLSRSHHHPFVSSLILALAPPQSRLLSSFPTAVTPVLAPSWSCHRLHRAHATLTLLVGFFLPDLVVVSLHSNNTCIILKTKGFNFKLYNSLYSNTHYISF